ncbi:hypothetical protein [Aquibacillus albus]|uniref:Type III secretory pathway component EscS n=1 Tax=Aquibacillus albus TaxID=1168171 RepID=A0ABS2MXZ3_9BACI|nr:hypothetical protein [Aquibacillus albus]MBM7570759.1 type III secretory pathway component EscS [Aquibacillus albus]
MLPNLQIRFLGIIGWIGSVIFVLFSLLHPPTFNPWDIADTFEKVSHHGFWVIDHIFITIGITCWLLAMAAGQGLFRHHGIIKKIGSWLFILSLATWVIILAFEIGVIPFLVDAIGHHQNETFMMIWFIVFGFGLFAGYIAFIFTWLGVAAYSFAMSRDQFPNWFRLSGIWSGFVGVIGITLGLTWIEFVVPILALTSGPPFIWTIVFLSFMVKKQKKYKKEV